MGFAEEVQAVNANKTATPEVVAKTLGAMPEATKPAEPVKAEAKAPVYENKELDFNSAVEKPVSLPVGEKPIEAKAKVDAEKAKAAEPVEVTEKPKPMLRIGGVEFSDIETALKYADQIAIAKQQDEAYLNGYSKAKDEANPKAAEKSIDEIIEEKFYQNPKEAIGEIRKVIKDEIFGEYNKMTAEAQRVQDAKEASEKLWDGFYKTNPDLSDPATRDYVQNYLLRKPENFNALKDLPLDKSLPKLAEMARTALKIKREDALPTQELQSGPAVVPGASGEATNSATPSTAPEILDFTTQVNRLRRRSK